MNAFANWPACSKLVCMKRRSLLVALGGGWPLWKLAASVSTDEAPRDAAVQAVLESYVQRGEAAGVVAASFTPEKILTLNLAGWADLEARRPIGVDSLFWIASMTKPITAMAVMKLRDEGKLGLDDPVAKFLPEFGAESSLVKAITVRQLLTHTSGLSGEPAGFKPATLAELVALYPSQPPRFAPGERWEYSNPGINTLGRMVEVLSGQSYEAFLNEHFFRPLGMKDTTFHLQGEQVQRLAKTYKKDKSGKLLATGIAFFKGEPLPPPDGIPYPAGGLFSTAADLIPFYQMVLRGGEAQGRRYIKKETLQEMASLQTEGLTTGFTPGSSWGLGWCRVAEPQGVTAALSPGSFGHGGAYGTQVWLDPVKQRGYLLLWQRADLPNSDGSDLRRDFQNAAAAVKL